MKHETRRPPGQDFVQIYLQAVNIVPGGVAIPRYGYSLIPSRCHMLAGHEMHGFPGLVVGVASHHRSMAAEAAGLDLLLVHVCASLIDGIRPGTELYPRL